MRRIEAEIKDTSFGRCDRHGVEIKIRGSSRFFLMGLKNKETKAKYGDDYYIVIYDDPSLQVFEVPGYSVNYEEASSNWLFVVDKSDNDYVVGSLVKDSSDQWWAIPKKGKESVFAWKNVREIDSRLSKKEQADEEKEVARREYKQHLKNMAEEGDSEADETLDGLYECEANGIYWEA